MERSVGWKLATILFLMALLLGGLLWIGALVTERQTRRDHVVQEIAQSSSLAQLIAGPVIVVPYTRTVSEWKEETGSGTRRLANRQVDGQLVVLPEIFDLDGGLRTERRARGIYEARLYHADTRVHAVFQIPPHYGVVDDLASYHFGQPSVAVGISDIRGIESISSAALDGMPAKLLPGTTSTLLGGGIHAPVPASDNDVAARMEFLLQFKLQGTSELRIMPVGRETQISLRADWPNPSFIGQYLPAQRTIDGHAFSAHWATSFFATNLQEALERCERAGSCEEFSSRLLGVSLVDPVDQYLKTDRAVKYALLFISLTFAGFFLFEVLRKLAIHPIQYGLVGAALAVFYLLLLSLAEHVGFALAYLSSAAACVALIGFYVSSVLHSAARGLGFGCALAVLYATLYGLLGVDDYALLLGAILLFGLLTAVMILTRDIDWFSLGRDRR